MGMGRNVTESRCGKGGNHEIDRLEACDQLLRERARIAAVLADLPVSWGQVRKSLNEIQMIVCDVREGPSSRLGKAQGP